MKKKTLAIVISSSLAAALVLGLTRWLAPQLLGVPLDFEIVQSSDEVLPFYDVVLNEKEINGKKNYIKDPHLRHRYKPLHKKHPTDILGFRNRGVPNKIDVLTVGDSQTWGNNAPVDGSWPGHLGRLLERQRAIVYNAAVGGWGAVEYLEITEKMLVFEPKVVVVAFYTGNDPLDSFGTAYAKERWKSLRPADLPQKIEGPKVNYPPKESEKWSVEFRDGVKTVFTPHGRYACNQDHPAADAGYRIVETVANRIGQMARDIEARTVFTIIPTKELAFSPRVSREGITQDKTYAALVEAEAKRIRWLKNKLARIPFSRYADVVSPLQQAISNTSVQYYPRSGNGHPTSAGYRVIADAVASQVKEHL